MAAGCKNEKRFPGRNQWYFVKKVNRLRRTRKFTRLCLTLGVKLPLLWEKISYLGLVYDRVSPREWRAALFAILIGWYTVVQMLPDFMLQARLIVQACGKTHGPSLCAALREAGLVTLLLACLANQAMHFAGLFWCPQGHNFSLIQGGCKDFVRLRLLISFAMVTCIGIGVCALRFALKRAGCAAPPETVDADSDSSVDSYPGVRYPIPPIPPCTRRAMTTNDRTEAF